MKTRNFYTANGWQGSNYDGNLSIAEINGKIREYLKKEFPDCKFSVTKDGGAWTDKIIITLLEAPEQVLTSGDYGQFIYVSNTDKRITEYGYNTLNKIRAFAQSFNYDDSDSMIDYFDTRFYLNINVGKWDKPFKVVEKTETKKDNPVQINSLEIIDYSEKAFAVIGETKPIKDTLKDLGGRFNFRLSCGAGWIFPKSKETTVKMALGL